MPTEIEHAYTAGFMDADGSLTEVAMAFRQHRKYDGPPVTEDTFHSILDDCDVSVE